MDIPPLILAEIKRFLEPECWLVPAWCQRVAVGWMNTTVEGASACCSASYEYRWARITVYPQWLDYEEDEKRRDILHELLHIPLVPYSDFVRDTCKTLLDEKDAKLQSVIQEQFRQRIESVVCDLTRLIDQKTRH